MDNLSALEDKYTIIYIFVPLKDVETYMSDKPVSFCKIGMTTCPYLTYKDINESIIKRGKSTGYPYEMKAVDYLVFDKTNLKIDNIFRAIVYEIGRDNSYNVKVSMDINPSEDLVVSPGREFVYNCRKTYVDISKNLVKYIISETKDVVYEQILSDCNEKILYNLDQFKTSKYYVVNEVDNYCINNEVKDNSNDYLVDKQIQIDKVSNAGKEFRLENVCNIADYVYLRDDREFKYLGKNIELRRCYEKVLSSDNKAVIADALLNIETGLDKFGIDYFNTERYENEYSRLIECFKEMPICMRVQGIEYKEVYKSYIQDNEDNFIENLIESLKFQIIGNYFWLDDYDMNEALLFYLVWIIQMVKRSKTEYKLWGNMNAEFVKYNQCYEYLKISKIDRIIATVKNQLVDAFHPLKIMKRSAIGRERVEIRPELMSGVVCDINHLSGDEWKEIVEITRDVIGKKEIEAGDIIAVFREDIVREENFGRKEFLDYDRVQNLIDKFGWD